MNYTCKIPYSFTVYCVEKIVITHKLKTRYRIVSSDTWKYIFTSSYSSMTSYAFLSSRIHDDTSTPPGLCSVQCESAHSDIMSKPDWPIIASA